MRYEKMDPITDPRQALLLLTNPWKGRWAGAWLYDGHENNGQPYIEVAWAAREYEGGSYRYYRVDPLCVKELVEKYWVEGVPHSGWTDEHKFTLSRSGIQQLNVWERELEKEAYDQLKVGVHGWSSIFNYKGKHKLQHGNAKDQKEGYLFVNPFGEHFIVSLPEKVVEKVDKKELGL
jgi:hypothetical protein